MLSGQATTRGARFWIDNERDWRYLGAKQPSKEKVLAEKRERVRRY